MNLNNLNIDNDESLISHKAQIISTYSYAIEVAKDGSYLLFTIASGLIKAKVNMYAYNSNFISDENFKKKDFPAFFIVHHCNALYNKEVEEKFQHLEDFKKNPKELILDDGKICRPYFLMSDILSLYDVTLFIGNKTIELESYLLFTEDIIGVAKVSKEYK